MSTWSGLSAISGNLILRCNAVQPLPIANLGSHRYSQADPLNYRFHAPATKRPVPFSDQHNASVLGAEGHPDVKTPHMDTLADSGVRFTRAYCQDAICTPSRCSLFSGQYPRTLGCRGNLDRTPVMEKVTSLQEVFQSAGYGTAAFGKRHLYQGCDCGWDIAASHLAVESQEDNYVDWVSAQGHGEDFDWDWAAEFGRGAEGRPSHHRTYPNAHFSVRESRLPAELTMEAWTRQRTVDFIREQSGQEPFFCFASFYRPHQPYTPLPEYYARFDRSHWGRGRLAGDGLAMPPSLRQPVEQLPPSCQAQTASTRGPWRWGLARADEQKYRDYLAAYYALLEEIDDHIGGILAALDASNQRDNTIIVYSSDHGDFVGTHGMGEKCALGQNVYESTLRVPMIFSFPRSIPAGGVESRLTELVDIYPTLAELCGIADVTQAQALPPQGRSLVPLLGGESLPWRTHSVSESWNQSTVITERYKLGVWTEPGMPPYQDFRDFGDMLFDLEADPHEMHNLAGHSRYTHVETELRNLLEQWLKAAPPSTIRNQAA